VELIRLGLLAITAGWMYLLALGIGYAWHQVF
jgi:hypothetical protein